ncbi:type II toxin-antitoxin system RelE/ParE family toxin [Lapidilactobacillus dextrinicus]|uniref:type II toxin-antitoxin system RelE/ParE family toxin n=1 Tax=Lapidilactobacillus dextrinicus TaxID=51664 RepID=UPI0022E873B1|nr:type II toxin-antitoxin system RelE/ParE family toxin [Lapidilactobacillus dextrinicus]
MRIDYKDNKLRKQCTLLSVAKKNMPEKVAKKLLQLVNFIDAADNLSSVISNPVYHFHQLKGDKRGLYAMDIDGRRKPQRLLVTFDDKDNNQIFQQSITIIEIRIEEVSNHYE